MTRGTPEVHISRERRRLPFGLAVTAAVVLLGATSCATTGDNGSAMSSTVAAPASSTASGASSAAPSGSAARSSAPGSSSAAAATASPAATGSSTSGTASAGETAKVQQSVDKALQSLAAGAPKPTREQIRNALVSAGIAPAAMEISASRTPTGLDVDAIQAGVLSGTQCVMAEVRDGKVSTTVLPALSDGKCFLGSDRG